MNCSYCGTELKKTSWGRWFCPNCGVIDSNEQEETKAENTNKDYIG